MKKSILLSEHDSFIGDAYGYLLSKFYKVYVASSAQETIDCLDNYKIDLLVTDTMLGKNNGVEILYEVRSHGDWSGIPIIILSTLPQSDFPIAKSKWSKYGIVSFLYKPETKPATLLREVTSTLL